MSGINCQLIVCILVVLINMFNNRVNNYLERTGYTYGGTHMPTCGLSINQRLHCPQPAELLLG